MYLKPSERPSVKTENDSTCYECQGGGELVCCDSCIKSFHVECLERSVEPQPDSSRWFCPVCRDMKTNVLMKLGHTWAHEAREEDAPLPVDSITGMRPRRSTRRTQTATKPKENNVIMSEGTWDNNAKINVGPGFQVPNEPRFYLEAEAVGASYSTLDPMLSCKKEVVMTRLHRGLSECETMFSPYVLRRKWSDLALEAQKEKLAAFREDVESQWPLEKVHFPFYPDFALNLLHTCDYDTEYAVRYLQSEDFDFLMACKPPQKAYLNKWSPQDRRGAFPCTPYKYQFNRR